MWECGGSSGYVPTVYSTVGHDLHLKLGDGGGDRIRQGGGEKGGGRGAVLVNGGGGDGD